MAFYVQKSLAHGPIRFGVAPRKEIDKIDSDAALSTGPNGEFARRSADGLFFAGAPVAIGAPTLPTEKSITTTTFLSSLKPDGTPRRWGFLALMILGVVFVLLGFAVIANKGPQGWVEVILGILMIATPIALTARERKAIREREEKERAEREERERRHREMLAAYTSALQQMRANVSDETLRGVRKERETLDLPYEIWAPVARQTVLAIGFDALAKLSPARAKDIATRMTSAAQAAGLTPEDEADARRAVYRAALWHLVADDRIGSAQQKELQQLRGGLGVDADEDHVLSQFDRLRGVTRTNLPKVQCPAPLQFREYCVFTGTGERLEKKNAHAVTVFVTNKRLIIDATRRMEVPLVKIDDIEVDGDQGIVTVNTADAKQPIRLRMPEPFYAAALIDIASTLDERPRGFA